MVPPAPPPAEKSPVARPRSRSGNHSWMSRSPGSQVAAAPAPTTQRASRLCVQVWASAKASAPTAITPMQASITRRGPSRSVSTPTGTCMSA